MSVPGWALQCKLKIADYWLVINFVAVWCESLSCAVDVLPCVYGPSQEHDLLVWARHMSDVRRPNAWMPNLPQADWKTHTSVLNIRQNSCASEVYNMIIVKWKVTLWYVIVNSSKSSSVLVSMCYKHHTCYHCTDVVHSVLRAESLVSTVVTVQWYFSRID